MKGRWNPKYEYWTCWTLAISRNCRYGVVPSCLGIEVIHALLTPDPPLLLSVGEKDGELLLQQHFFLTKKMLRRSKTWAQLWRSDWWAKQKTNREKKKHKTSVTVAWIFIALSKFISHIWALESSLESHLCVSWGSRKKNITGFLEKKCLYIMSMKLNEASSHTCGISVYSCRFCSFIA